VASSNKVINHICHTGISPGCLPKCCLWSNLPGVCPPVSPVLTVSSPRPVGETVAAGPLSSPYRAAPESGQTQPSVKGQCRAPVSGLAQQQLRPQQHHVRPGASRQPGQGGAGGRGQAGEGAAGGGGYRVTLVGSIRRADGGICVVASVDRL
jgi:hypothetical protein